MSSIVIEIPDGEVRDDGNYDCWPDEDGNAVYIRQDDARGRAVKRDDAPVVRVVIQSGPPTRADILADLGVE